MSRNFRATVKEGREGEPCSVWLEMHEEIGLGNKIMVLDLPDGTGITEAQHIASALNDQVENLRLFAV